MFTRQSLQTVCAYTDVPVYSYRYVEQRKPDRVPALGPFSCACRIVRLFHHCCEYCNLSKSMYCIVLYLIVSVEWMMLGPCLVISTLGKGHQSAQTKRRPTRARTEPQTHTHTTQPLPRGCTYWYNKPKRTLRADPSGHCASGYVLNDTAPPNVIHSPDPPRVYPGSDSW